MNDELGTISICYSLQLKRRSRHSPARLWRAITTPDEVAKWMGFPAHIELRPGGDYTVDFDAANPGDKLDGVIIKAEPERLLRYAWGHSVVDWSIEPDGDGCRHTFVQAGLTPRDVADEEGLVAGWHDFLDSLDEYLDGVARPEAAHATARWEGLKVRYRPRLAEVLGDALK
jgi:uncharacterized protein YndB with AHSA1/START domain